MAKYRMSHLAHTLRAEGWNVASMHIMGNNGMVNYGWVYNFVHLQYLKPAFAPLGPFPYTFDDMPMVIDRVDATGSPSPSGKFVAGMNAGGYNAFHAFAGNGYQAVVTPKHMGHCDPIPVHPGQVGRSCDGGVRPGGIHLENLQDAGFESARTRAYQGSTRGHPF